MNLVESALLRLGPAIENVLREATSLPFTEDRIERVERVLNPFLSDPWEVDTPSPIASVFYDKEAGFYYSTFRQGYVH